MVIFIGWAIAAGAMAADWFSVARQRGSIEAVAKPLVMIGLLVVAVTGDIDDAPVRALIITALALGLAGDVFLLPQIDNFLAGLGAFLVGHASYAVAFVLLIDLGSIAVIGPVGGLVLLAVFGIPIIRSLQGSPLRIPVAMYIAVTTGVILLGAATGRPLIAIGALLFALSDGVLGHDRFVDPDADHRVWVHVLYHTGQATILAGVIS